MNFLRTYFFNSCYAAVPSNLWNTELQIIPALPVSPPPTAAMLPNPSQISPAVPKPPIISPVEPTAPSTSQMESNTVGIPTTEPSTGTSKISPVVAVVREFLKPMENTPTKKSKKVTKARLITAPEFAKEMEEKEKLREEKENEKKEKLEERANEKKKKLEERARKAADKAQKNDKQTGKEDKENAPVKKSKKEAPGNNLKKKVPANKNKKRALGVARENIEKTVAPGPSKPVKNQRKRKVESSSEDSASDKLVSSEREEDNTLCGTCQKSFQRDFDGEAWIQCTACTDWYHISCQEKEESFYDPAFICDECLPLA